jgi:hypothetical protein
MVKQKLDFSSGLGPIVLDFPCISEELTDKSTRRKPNFCFSMVTPILIYYTMGYSLYFAKKKSHMTLLVNLLLR